MNRLKQILILSLIFLGSACSNGKKSDTELEHLKGKVKSIRTICYSINEGEDGSIEKEYIWRGEFGTSKDEQIIFDEEGYRQKDIRYKDNKVNFERKYYYNQNNELTTILTDTEVKVWNKKLMCQSSRDGLSSSGKVYWGNGKFAYNSRVGYNPNGSLKSYKFYYEDKRIWRQGKIRYQNGYLVEELRYEGIELNQKITYKYNDKNELIEEIHYEGDGTTIRSKEIFSNYKYDNQGNWIERRSKYSAPYKFGNLLTERKIEYFD